MCSFPKNRPKKQIIYDERASRWINISHNPPLSKPKTCQRSLWTTPNSIQLNLSFELGLQKNVYALWKINTGNTEKKVKCFCFEVFIKALTTKPKQKGI